MKEGHGGVVIGSEISGGVRNVFAENCQMDSPNLERALRFKTNSVRGGVVENIFARNITVGQVSDAVIRVDYYYEEGDKGDFTPVMRNFHFSNITSGKSPYAIWIKAYERSPLDKFSLTNCSFTNVGKDNILQYVKDKNFQQVFVNGREVK
jgi:polygalacturonase